MPPLLAALFSPPFFNTPFSTHLTRLLCTHLLQSYTARLLGKEVQLQADFTWVADSVNKSKVDGVTRFVQVRGTSS